ncbi:hypothetical protein [Erythrobacter sp. EC-HK427]|uniref:hypothetical protein n=1 Tax=Erythrobacter sp. EC-HK427 TaxID=2038396 RepID=UPI00125449BD|nr:hypothetical protein [Erythrobacter sp. EC-HK427]VVT00698.1 conserved exported hypothetical protein [Erythrobacter sp. EC-HK427]
MKLAVAAAIVVAISSPVMAQEVQNIPLRVADGPQGNAILPAGTQIPLRMVDTVTTSRDTWEQGDTFDLVVAHDIMLGQYIVIPAGSPAQGRITELSSRGAFGRSGKMDIEIEHIIVHNQRINVNGTFRQEGEGATLETLGGVLVAGVFAGFITGESATIPAGRELTVTLENGIEIDVLASDIENESRQISEADADWRTYHQYTDRNLTPSARVMQARQMRDAAIADAQNRAAGQANIRAAVVTPPIDEEDTSGEVMPDMAEVEVE